MSNAYPITRITVRDTPPPQRPTISVGRIYPIVPKAPEPEVVFRTVEREEEPIEDFKDEAETKVMRGRRRGRPAANEDAETK